MKIAVLHFVHETVTFLANETTLDDFIYEGSPAKGEALLGIDPKSYMGGFVKVAREHADVELVGIESPLQPKTGIGSGWITREAFEFFVGRMVEQLKAEGPFDGVYLALHGAMGVTGIPRPEAEIARRVRQAVGASAFIAATFDPHGNEDEAFLQAADLAFTVKYYPHYDAYLQGTRAARNLIRCIRGDLKPTHASRKVPLISPTVLQWTGSAAWMSLINRALTWEAREPDVYVNVFFGFPWSDVPDAGMFVQVTTHDDPTLAAEVLADMVGTIWRQKDVLLSSADIVSIPAAIGAAAQACEQGAFPVVIADHSDRSGYATWVLDEIIRQELSDTVVATVADASALDRVQSAGLAVGDTFEAAIGGRVDPSAGEAVSVVGKVLHVPQLRAKDAGRLPFVTVGFGRNNVVVISRYLTQIMEPSELAGFGIELGRYKVFAIKSRVHFRLGFDDSGFAKKIVIAEPDEPFLGTTRLQGLGYRNLDLSSFYPYRRDASF
ncbi:M81 family metallopeptidase [Paraburkholderia sp. ZP32-5]|uniref:M81 family metallopeptidase n=1 Tax=Paraburkholderia sp. ZP32-5 TaxID=2883245 RepID=UPI001F268FB4|nr:M81 family metallopeptidase [Paraburkholderia sp. ZP32-5]